VRLSGSLGIGSIPIVSPRSRERFSLVSIEATLTASTGHPRRWTILWILCSCLVLVVASVSSLNVAIPQINQALLPTSIQQLWILDAYALVFAGLLLFCGALGDRFGRKKILLTGLMIYALAAIFASTTDSATALIAARAIMGVGAALIMPSTLSIITIVFSDEERPKAIAIWAGFAGAGGAIGPLLSGFLLEHFWWGSVFLINVPIAVAAAVAITAVVPESRDENRRPLDFAGAALSIVALGGLVFGIIQGPEAGWTDPLTLSAFALGVLGVIAFVWWESRIKFPMLDPAFFKIRRFSLSSYAVTNAFLVMFGMFYLITLYLQFVQGYSALDAAIRLLPFSVCMIIVAPRSPQLVARFGQRSVVIAGLLIQSFGFMIASQLEVDSGYALLLCGVGAMATGMALLMPPSTNSIVSSLPRSKAGVGSAVNDTTREVGGAIGIALMGSLLSIGYRSGLGDSVDQLPPEAAEAVTDNIGGALVVADSIGGDAGAALAETARNAYIDGSSVAFIVAACIGLLNAFVYGFFWPRRSSESEPEPSTTSA
jgi:EmrB/QacA subfamily drug resistance transporter